MFKTKWTSYNNTKIKRAKIAYVLSLRLLFFLFFSLSFPTHPSTLSISLLPFFLTSFFFSLSFLTHRLLFLQFLFFLSFFFLSSLLHPPPPPLWFLFFLSFFYLFFPHPPLYFAPLFSPHPLHPISLLPCAHVSRAMHVHMLWRFKLWPHGRVSFRSNPMTIVG